MMVPDDPLGEYRRKRDAARTPEPVPETGPAGEAAGDIFVIQQHHARRLHWDLRLARGGVLVSWAVPRGVPPDPARNHLAVHTEDHPMEYADFSGEIPAGEYGGGRMTIYDRGTYTTEKWHDDEVIVVLRGSRVAGRYALYQTAGRDWMIHRMGPPEPGWAPMPERISPMTAVPAETLPAVDEAWGYELCWPGVRALGSVSGGRLRLLDAHGHDITARYPEVRTMAEALAPTECLLDGVIVAFDATGRVSEAVLRPRVAADGTAVKRLTGRVPVQYLAVDLLWLDGRPTLDVPYAQRRDVLLELGVTGAHWQTPPHFTGGGADVLAASAEQGAPGVIAKRLDSPYRPGPGERDRAGTWLRILRPGDSG